MNTEKGMPKTPGLAKAAAVLTRSLASQGRTKAQPDEIHKMLVLSTAHITEAMAGYLEQGTGPDDLVAFEKSDHGWFVVVSDADFPVDNEDDDWNIAVHEFNGLLTYARARGCTWIMLDQDGPVVDGLKTWEW